MDAQLELLETPIALVTPEGVIRATNAAFRHWTSTDNTDAAAVLDLEWASVASLVTSGKRHAIKRTGKSDRGRPIPVEYQLRANGSTIVVEGRDLSRIHEKEALLQSFAKTIEVNNRQLARAHESMQRLLDSVDQGLVTLDRLGRVTVSRSAAFDRWFGTPDVGTSFIDCLERVSPETATIFYLGWSQLEAGVLPLALSLDQLPARMSSSGNHYRIRYKAEAVGEVLSHLLVVISDITHEIERERAEAHERALINLMSRYASDRGGLREFLREADSLTSMIQSADVDSTELLRAVHTLKGTCALFGVQVVADRCHELESRVAELGDLPSDVDRRLLAEVWRALREQIGVFLEQDSDTIVLAREELDDLRRQVRTMSPERLLDMISTWTWERGDTLLERVGDQICSLATRLGRAPVDIELDGGGLRFERERWSRFWGSLVHVVRNVVDHAIEPVEERVALGKPARARVGLRAWCEDDRVVVEIADDGRGIDWTAVAEKARALGFDASNQDALVSALLGDGFSTRTRVSEQSGRGVGLAVVQSACAHLGGTVAIESELGQGTRFRFRVPRAGVAEMRAVEERAASSGSRRTSGG
jgi:signal transduction histidine kinase